jgi:RND family efflux transporter MFP subunit
MQDTEMRPNPEDSAAASRRGRGFWRRLPLPLIVLTLGVCAFMVLVTTRPETKPVENRETVWSVAGKAVSFDIYEPRITAFGELRARREVQLRAQVSGEVMSTETGFENGALVAKGDVLLRIDPFNYQTRLDEAKAQLKGAEALLTERKAAADLARQDMKRAQELFEKGTVSKKTLDDRKTDYTIKKARRDQQQSVVDRQKVAVKRARRDLDNTTITAPFDGHVADINVRAGRVVGPNEPLGVLFDADAYEVVFNLSDAEYGRFLARNSDVIGRVLDVQWTVGTQKMKLQAMIERVGAQISQATRGVDIFARVMGDIPSNLRGGAFVDIVLKAQPLPDVMVIPKDAIYDGERVFVAENGRLAPRRLENPIDLGRHVAVRDGLSVGEIVVLTRFNEAAPGVAIRLVEGK